MRYRARLWPFTAAVRRLVFSRTCHRLAAGFAMLLAGYPALAQPPRDGLRGPDRSDLAILVSHTAIPTVWMGGSSGPDHDYPRLLSEYGDALVEAGVGVLKVYVSDLAYGDAAEVERILKFCRANGLKLAVEGYLVSAFSHSEISEGEAPPGTIERLVRRLQSMNGRLDYFESDETLFRAHSVYKHSIADIAANAARNAQILRTAFPAIQIADIEPFPQDMVELRSFLQAFAQEAHHPFDIYNPDIAWNSEYGNTRWREKLLELSKLVHDLHMGLAVIYNGNDKKSQNSLQWITLAEQRIAAVESDPSLGIGNAIIQSWAKYPTKIGPPNEPGTMLNLATVYSSLVRLYRSGYLAGHVPPNASIEAPASIALGPTGHTSLAVRVNDQGTRRSADSRVAVVLIAAGGTFDAGGLDSLPTLVRGSKIKVVAGTIEEVNSALDGLTISGTAPQVAVDVEVFGAKGNIDRKQVLLSRTGAPRR